MVSLLISFAVLLVGYLIYGRVAEKVFAPDGRKTPAIAIHDGILYCCIALSASEPPTPNVGFSYDKNAVFRVKYGVLAPTRGFKPPTCRLGGLCRCPNGVLNIF